MLKNRAGERGAAGVVAIEDQHVGVEPRQNLKRNLTIGASCERRADIVEAGAREDVVDQRARPDREAVGLKHHRTQARQARIDGGFGDLPIHLGDQRLAARRFAERRRDQADLPGGRPSSEFDRADPADRRADPLEQRDRRRIAERAGEHEIGPIGERLLGKAAIGRDGGGERSQIAVARVLRQKAHRGERARIGEPQRQLVGAEIERDDALRLGERGRGEENGGEEARPASEQGRARSASDRVARATVIPRARTTRHAPPLPLAGSSAPG